MKSQIAATMSDSVNRKSMRMDTGALYDSMKNSFDVGMPLLISHDRHRPAGWTVPAAVYLEPGLTRVLAYIIEPETDEDYSQIQRRWVKFIASTIHDVPQESITRLTELLGTDVLTDSEIPWNSGAHALRGAGLAQRAFPEIFEQMDKDGLVPFTALTMIRPGIFQIGELCVFAHQFMRRSESPFNHFNEDLLDVVHRFIKLIFKLPHAVRQFLWGGFILMSKIIPGLFPDRRGYLISDIAAMPICALCASGTHSSSALHTARQLD